MLYLKIENGKGYFLNADGGYDELNKISKEDILRFIEKAEDEGDNFVMNEFNEDLIQNEAHKIIYEKLYLKLKDFINNLDHLNDMRKDAYQEAVKAYKAEDIDVDKASKSISNITPDSNNEVASMEGL